MAKQTIESKIRGALRDASSDDADGTVVVTVADIAGRTSLTFDQVTRFARSNRWTRYIGRRNVSFSRGEFEIHPTPPPAKPMRPRAPKPAWFAPPAGEVTRDRWSAWNTRTHSMFARQAVEYTRRGGFVLPPWQRGSVWTEAQRVALLDSIMRGASIGSITLWVPYRDDETPPAAFDGCPIGESPRFVVDGQQRLTTLLMAARGELDHWRWDGLEWSTGDGFMTPSKIVGNGSGDDMRDFEARLDWHEWACSYGERQAKQMYADIERLELYELTAMSIEGSVDHMVEVYRRLATFGSPHSVEDLAHMDRWFASK